MAISLEGKTAIVTASALDVGKAIAQKFVDSGARVMLAGLDDKALQAVSEEIDAAEGTLGRFPYVAQDRLSIGNLIAATVEKFERIDVLVNGAQTLNAPGGFLDLKPDAFDSAFGDNVRGVFQLSQAVAKRMIAQAGDGPTSGSIVNISSIAAERTVPELLTFSVSCAALDQLTRSMAISLAPHQIRVNAIALGGVMSGRLLNAFRDDETLRDDMLKVTPLGRLGEVSEAGDAALFLSSDQASYVTGQVLGLDGGRALLDPLASPVR